MLSYAIGFLSRIKTTPIPSPETSHSNTKGLEKSSNASTKQLLIISFIFQKDFFSSSSQLNSPFLVRSIKGAVKLE